MNNLFQNFFYINTVFCGNPRRILCFDSDNILYLRNNPVRLRTWKVNFVNDRHNLQIMVQGQINVRQRLCLNPLCGIDHQNCSLTGSKAPAHFIIKIHMSRCINQVENIFFSVLRLINNTYGLRLDGNSPFSFQVHIIKHLILHLPVGQQSGHFNNTVSQGRLSVINMSNNTKITDLTLIYSSQRFFLPVYTNLFFSQTSKIISCF